ncbi:MAG: hypothetical protein LBI13_11390 [Streptococcaceae bacterium]|jgi:hypothetical protein|nr:hypothetical protein [Streptococcaceae bacterium]
MAYQLKITYPREESATDNRTTERTVHEYLEELEIDDVIQEYEKCLTKGYSVATTFTPPEVDAKGAEPDPFAIASEFVRTGIVYKATLKLKATGSYEQMSKIAKIIEQEGYDYDIAVKLKVNENSPVDFEKESSWFDSQYAKYTINPKASTEDINELKALYDLLVEAKQEVKINLKAKVKKDDDESFATQLAAYPDETLISLRLTDADLYGE